jgi:hypothetical protein
MTGAGSGSYGIRDGLDRGAHDLRENLHSLVDRTWYVEPEIPSDLASYRGR